MLGGELRTMATSSSNGMSRFIVSSVDVEMRWKIDDYAEGVFFEGRTCCGRSVVEAAK